MRHDRSRGIEVVVHSTHTTITSLSSTHSLALSYFLLLHGVPQSVQKGAQLN